MKKNAVDTKIDSDFPKFKVKINLSLEEISKLRKDVLEVFLSDEDEKRESKYSYYVHQGVAGCKYGCYSGRILYSTYTSYKKAFCSNFFGLLDSLLTFKDNNNFKEKLKMDIGTELFKEKVTEKKFSEAIKFMDEIILLCQNMKFSEIPKFSTQYGQYLSGESPCGMSTIYRVKTDIMSHTLYKSKKVDIDQEKVIEFDDFIGLLNEFENVKRIKEKEENKSLVGSLIEKLKIF